MRTPDYQSSSHRQHRAWFNITANLHHPLLLALPFPEGVHDCLSKFQELVAIAINVDQQAPDRVDAVVQLAELAQHSPIFCAERELLLSELCMIVKRSMWSAQLIELQVQLILESSDLRICQTAPTGKALGCIYLTKNGEVLPPGPPVCRRAKTLLAGLVEELESRSRLALSELGMQEALACIRLLFLFQQYAIESPKSGEAAEEARVFHSGTGRSLWAALVSGVAHESCEDAEEFDYQYGARAYNQLTHRLGIAMPQSAVEKTVSSDPKSPQLPTFKSVDSNCATHLVAIEPFTPSVDSDVRATLKQFSALLQPLPLAQMPTVPSIDLIAARLLAEFPWADDALAGIFDDLRTRRLFGALDVNFTPVLLLGPPGVGKTRLARRIAEELALPFHLIGLGGMADARCFLGTSRGWSSGQPSPLLALLARRSNASALVVLDEVEKTMHHSSNSVAPTTALLGLLEPENARCWYDTYLQARCDLSRLLYIATANSVDGIAGPLLSRMSVHVLRRPTPSQLAEAMNPVLTDLAKEWSLPRDVLPSVSAAQLPGSPQNLRQLKTLARSYLADWARTNLGPGRLH